MADPDATFGSPQAVRFLYYDTFDWRLYRRGLTLVRDHDAVRLRDRTTGRIRASLPFGHDPLPPLVRDWPDDDLRSALVPMVKVRALLLLVTLDGIARDLVVVDPKSARPWRLKLFELWARRGPRSVTLPPVLAMLPADGRNRGGKRLAKKIVRAGFAPLPPTLCDPALRAVRIRPGAYTSRVRVDLDPEAPVGESAAAIARRLLQVMEDNLAGTRRDVDTEFLHDLRVAMRRTRSLLSLLKGVIPGEIRKTYQARFRDLGSVTGPVRDLDVHLLGADHERALLPKKHRPGHEELTARDAERRAAAFGAMAARLDAGDFRSALDDWRAVLEESGTWSERRAGSRTTAEAAAEVIDKAYRRLRDRGLAMGAEPDDEDLHRLRIAGKKFRYAVEFFAGLGRERDVDHLLAVMKRLQDLLGENNDLAVRTDDLARVVDHGGELGMTKSARRTAAVLVERWAERRADLRRDFGAAFAEFVSKETAKRVRKLTRSLP